MKKTTKNPHGLTGKQLLAVEDMVAKAQAGKSVTPVESTKKVYNVGSHNSAKSITSRNMHNPDFRAALLDGFYEKQVLGDNSKIESRLEEGLDATDKEGLVDYTNRLRYIQEINKIAGVYAVEKKEVKTMNLSMDITEEALDNKIKSLQKELKDR